GLEHDLLRRGEREESRGERERDRSERHEPVFDASVRKAPSEVSADADADADRREDPSRALVRRGGLLTGPDEDRPRIDEKVLPQKRGDRPEEGQPEDGQPEDAITADRDPRLLVDAQVGSRDQRARRHAWDLERRDETDTREDHESRRHDPSHLAGELEERARSARSRDDREHREELDGSIAVDEPVRREELRQGSELRAREERALRAEEREEDDEGSDRVGGRREKVRRENEKRELDELREDDDIALPEAIRDERGRHGEDEKRQRHPQEGPERLRLRLVLERGLLRRIADVDAFRRERDSEKDDDHLPGVVDERADELRDDERPETAPVRRRRLVRKRFRLLLDLG